MKNKIWHKVEIETEFQDISIYPTDQYDGIIIETKLSNSKTTSTINISKDEMEFMILKMREMMDYVNS